MLNIAIAQLQTKLVFVVDPKAIAQLSTRFSQNYILGNFIYAS